MAIWSVWAAPLYMSNDLRKLKPEFKEILANKKLIAVNQDKLGAFGLMTKQSDDGKLQAFVKPVEPIQNGCPSFALVYLSRHTLGGRRKVGGRLGREQQRGWLLKWLVGAPTRRRRLIGQRLERRRPEFPVNLRSACVRTCFGGGGGG